MKLRSLQTPLDHLEKVVTKVQTGLFDGVVFNGAAMEFLLKGKGVDSLYFFSVHWLQKLDVLAIKVGCDEMCVCGCASRLRSEPARNRLLEELNYNGVGLGHRTNGLLEYNKSLGKLELALSQRSASRLGPHALELLLQSVVVRADLLKPRVIEFLHRS